jgi:hypothetical protein
MLGRPRGGVMSRRWLWVLLVGWLGVGVGVPRAQAQDEVPFITTPDHVTLGMLELAAAGPSDYVIDLGSGDGRIVITAAKRFGARGLGVEIVPDLVTQSRASALAAGVAERARFEVRDLFATSLDVASIITLYLLPDVNMQLRPRLLALKPGTRIVSHDWDLGDWAPDHELVLAVPDKKVGLNKSSKLMWWVVPARIDGHWCGPRGLRLDIQQRFQRVSMVLTAPLAKQAQAPSLVADGQLAVQPKSIQATQAADWGKRFELTSKTGGMVSLTQVGQTLELRADALAAVAAHAPSRFTRVTRAARCR